jgi:hypothetical protein
MIRVSIRETVNAEEDNIGPFWGPGTKYLQGLTKLARAHPIQSLVPNLESSAHAQQQLNHSMREI